MIRLVEGAERQKTPNEIALSLLLVKFTIIFLMVIVALQPFAIYAGDRVSDAVLIALFVCLIPTTIGGLLSAIGIAGMDRLVQRNVLAMSGRAVEAAGDVSDAAARQDRHDHAREPAGGGVHPGTRRRRARVRRDRPDRLAAPTRPPRAARSWCWPRSGSGFASTSCCETHAQFVPFTAQTRMSGVDLDGTQIRKGAVDAVRRLVRTRASPRARRRGRAHRAGGGHPARCRERPRTDRRRSN